VREDGDLHRLVVLIINGKTYFCHSYVLWFFSSFGFLLIWIWGLPLRFVSGEVFLRSSGSQLRLVIPALIFPFLSLVLWSDGRPGRAAPCLCDFGSLFSPVLPCSPPLQIPFTSRTPGPADRPCSLRIFLSQQISAPASFSPPRFGLYVPCPIGEASVCSWCSVPFLPQAQQFSVGRRFLCGLSPPSVFFTGFRFSCVSSASAIKTSFSRLRSSILGHPF
jgi:hypothetical protein